jgi:hypothetical protein
MCATYLTLCILGTVLPYSQFGPFLVEHGLAPGIFVAMLFANKVSAFFGWDVIVSSVVVWVFVWSEGRRLEMGHLWIYVAATLLVGVSLALPLFLYVREGSRPARHADADG